MTPVIEVGSCLLQSMCAVHVRVVVASGLLVARRPHASFAPHRLASDTEVAEDDDLADRLGVARLLDALSFRKERASAAALSSVFARMFSNAQTRCCSLLLNASRTSCRETP